MSGALHLTRRVSISRTGRYVAMRQPGGLDVVDALGTAPRIRIDGDAADFACVGTALWVLRGRRIDRFALATGKPIGAIDLPVAAVRLIADRGEAGQAAIAVGAARQLAVATGEVVALPAEAIALLGGRSYAVALAGRVQVHEPGKPAIDLLRTDGEALAIHPLYGGRLIAVLVRSSEDAWWVVRRDGRRVHRIATARAGRWAVAGDAGLALAAVDGGWTRVNLRHGQIRVDARGDAESAALCDLDLSADGQHAVVAQGDPAAPAIIHLPANELFAPGPARPAVAAMPALRVVDAVDESPPDLPDPPELDPPEPAVPVVVPLPLALGAPLPPLEVAAAGDWPAYASAREHLDDLLDLVAARAARAIAQAWHSGRITAAFDRQPFLAEVRALLGEVAGLAPDEIAAADARLARMAERTSGRIRATLAAGGRLPLIDLMRELDLSPTAGHLLMIALGPGERGEIARLFGILCNDPNRPLVDRHLLETVFAGDDRAARAAVSAELADAAPLCRHGVLRIAGGPTPATFRSITVDPGVIARLCERDDDAAIPAVRALDELVVDPEALRELAGLVAAPRPPGEPLRLVVRGRLGSGRRSLIAALAARVGRAARDIDCTRLSRGGAAMAAELQAELRRVALRGAVPIVSGLEAVDRSDAEAHDRLRQVLRAHPGPLVIRTALESTPPLDRGFATVALPPLSETARAAFWRAALARAGLAVADVDGLAARWRIGPGIVERVIGEVAARRPSGDAGGALDAAARAHIAARLEHVATPVRRLAAWESVALPDDVIDSIREFIGRIAQRRTVFEDWGFDAKVASARGLTALFYGPPGTGKSMVAGLIARELGLELYRVDLSRVVSKWIGETEKQLAEVFDAAEDGQVVILFDEADSLFARRTEVKTSVDRYANLEVNYLLQRLDSFEGIAILTTNLDGSIDPAFKRRMSLRLQFPFPDVDMRQRLWAAHIPARAPVAGDFDFAELARRFPLSGGYIRNSALRAAFLAAQERRPLAQDHLLRAIALEYRELGKLAADGRME